MRHALEACLNNPRMQLVANLEDGNCMMGGVTEGGEDAI